MDRIAAVWTSLGVAGFYLTGSGLSGARNEPGHYGGGTWQVSAGALLLLAFGLLASLVSLLQTTHAKH